MTPGHHQGTAVLPDQVGEQPPAPPGHGTSLPRLVLWGQISAGRGEAGEGWDTTGAQCLHPAPSNHRLVTPGWRQPGLQAGSQHSRFLPGCLGQERSLTASRHHPGRRAVAWGSYGEAMGPKHSRATFPWADTAAPLGEWRHCGGAGQSRHAEGEAAGDAGAGKAEPQPGPRSRAAGVPPARGQSIPPALGSAGHGCPGWRRPCRQHPPAQRLPRGERRLRRQNDADLSYRDRLFPSGPTRSVPAHAPNCHRLPGSRGSGQGFAPASSGVGQACTAEGTDVTTCP